MTLMPLKKSQIILRMLDLFLSKGSLSKEEILSSVDISEVSFKRYVGEIRDYLRLYRPTYAIPYRRSLLLYVLERGDNSASVTPGE